MNYFITEPSNSLASWVKSFWMIESEDEVPYVQKIVPDGYPEIIFHFGDPFESRFRDDWQLQSKNLMAGQIRNFFFLRNTGKSAMFAIKFQPWAITELFGIKMSELCDKVVDIDFPTLPHLDQLRTQVNRPLSFEERVTLAEEWLMNYKANHKLNENAEVKRLASSIIESNGIVPLKNLIQNTRVSERTLERYFKNHIGLSPKFYSRVIRLAYIFSMVEDEHADWMDISFAAGFYDQSHFIKDFKAFTGDEPTRYPFLEKNMANFFLKK